MVKEDKEEIFDAKFNAAQLYNIRLQEVIEKCNQWSSLSMCSGDEMENRIAYLGNWEQEILIFYRELVGKLQEKEIKKVDWFIEQLKKQKKKRPLTRTKRYENGEEKLLTDIRVFNLRWTILNDFEIFLRISAEKRNLFNPESTSKPGSAVRGG